MAQISSARSASALSRFLALYIALFAAFGAASPFFAAFLAGRGLRPEAIGLVLAAGTAIRLLAGPLGGRLADRLGAPRWVLTAIRRRRLLVAFGYLPAAGLWTLLLVSVAHASVLAPINPIADALALAAGPAGRGFEYGWVRGAGSAAFIAGTLFAGQAVSRFGLVAIIWLNGTLLALAALCAARVPDRLRASGFSRAARQFRRPAASADVSPIDAGGGADPGQPRDARRVRGDPLGERRGRQRHDRPAVVGIGRRGSRRVPVHRAHAGRSAGPRGRLGAGGGRRNGVAGRCWREPARLPRRRWSSRCTG